MDALTTEINAQQQEIANEANNEKSWDDSASHRVTQDLDNDISQTISNATNIVKSTADLIVDATKYTGKVAKWVVVTTYDDAKVCMNNGWVQECLSTCGVSMDATTAAAGVTVVWLPIAAGTTIVWAACDFTNGLVYLWNGNRVAAGVSALAIIPMYGSLAKGSTKAVLKLTKEGEGAVRVVKGGWKSWKIASRASLSKNTQESLLKYEKSGWKSLWDRNWWDTWYNKGSDLPTNTSYKEYDVNIKQWPTRDAERFVRWDNNAIYYTNDHYVTFIQVQ